MSKARLDRKPGAKTKPTIVRKDRSTGTRKHRTPKHERIAPRPLRTSIHDLPELWLKAAKDKATRVELARRSVAFFAFWYLRAAGAPLAIPKCHRRWYKEIGTGDGYMKRPYRQRRMLLLAPRAHGKSMVTTLAVALHRICFNRNVRILLLSERDDGACKRLRRIRIQLESNKRILEDFGGSEGFKDPRQPWTDSGIYVRRPDSTMNEPTVEAAGSGGAITGGRFDLILVDDPESNKTVLTAGSRAKTRDWFWGTILELLEPWGEAVVIGTRKHHDDLYAHIINDPTFATNGPDGKGDRAVLVWPEAWEFVRDEKNRIVDATHVSTCDIRTKPKQDMACTCGFGKAEVLWPKRWPIGKLLAKREGSPSKTLFERENQNIVTSNEEAKFKLEWLDAAYDRGADVPRWRNADQVLDDWFVVLGCDPAFVEDEKTATKSDSDYFVIIAVAVNRSTWERRILGGYRRRGRTPNEFASALRKWATPFSLANDHFPAGALAGVAIEGNSFGKFYQIGLRRDTTLPLVAHTTGASKADPYAGVEAMASLFENGHVTFALQPPKPNAGKKAEEEWEQHVQFVDAMKAELYGFGAESHDDTVLAFWIAECFIRRLQAQEEKDKMRREGKRREASRDKKRPGESLEAQQDREMKAGRRVSAGRRGRGASSSKPAQVGRRVAVSEEVDEF